jgi:membrane protein YqaA with SNARE-associated domain
VLQIALSMGAPKRSFRFATVSGAGSVLGGMFGYLIGYALWQGVKGLFIPYLFSQATFDKVVQLYQDNAFFAVFSAAFTPIPYKVFTITAGVTQISFWMLVAGSLAGRFGRFYAVATVLYFFGPAAKEFIEKRFELLTLVFTVLLIGSFFLVKYVL